MKILYQPFLLIKVLNKYFLLYAHDQSPPPLLKHWHIALPTLLWTFTFFHSMGPNIAFICFSGIFGPIMHFFNFFCQKVPFQTYMGMQASWKIVSVFSTNRLLRRLLRCFKVHPSAGFASSNKISVSPRSNHREWLTQCKNSYYYEKKRKQ